MWPRCVCLMVPRSVYLKMFGAEECVSFLLSSLLLLISNHVKSTNN